ncbi:NnrS family protein [Ferruginivarius sediminum]|uniref:NnrS family protein n=1 Tax=Ferruginivarius sediminum TaxID=2661937 RepID=A0A369T6E7_9PROT|nr:NnrS family protein [Ferruginivarius sediminum]RDD60903.1 hypothetical protein DRB17_15700 [Ferruginivarius sediminum]
MARQGAAIPRYRTFSGPSLLSQGFRPFFLVAGVWSALAVLLWIGWLLGGWPLPLAMPGVLWHGHEMIFGYLVAALAGFLMTAVPNWTGRMPLQGRALAALTVIWGVGRLAMALGGALPTTVVAVADLAFLACLLAVMGREIVAGRNWRNLPILGALTLLLVANVTVHASAAFGFDPRIGLRLSVAMFVVLIALIGGRIVPSFTRNWLVKRGHDRHPAKYGHGDQAALLITLAAALSWTAAPSSGLTGVLAGAAALANAWRLSRWRGLPTWREPLLLILHLGYAWLPLGFALMAAASFSAEVPASAALHAMTAGAMGAMTLAVMTRTSLGHTGRALTADMATTVSYVLVIAAAVLRIAGALAPSAASVLHAAAGAAWVAAFAVFVAAYAPKLVAPRP